MNRWKAFAIHLTASVVIFLGLLGLILTVWYPGILFSIDGGWNGLKLVMGVDVILGPLLTLVVYRVGKPGLKFDLTCIVSLQVACMAAGLWVVYQSRPIALVFAYDTFYSLAANEFEAYGQDPRLINEFPGPSPKLIFAELPEDEFRAEVANLRSVFVADPLFMQTDKYKAIPEHGTAIFRWESSVRRDAEEQLRANVESREEGCVLNRFASAHTSGFVCYDPVKRKLSRFYENKLER
ncbi:MAG: hypothetical protein KJN90_05100 [Gammaproteobacteria bacterium]|nr:hypothetical protein [Gammaproteobacteria bacterium]